MRLKGQLRMYMQWPLIMTILLLAMNIWMYMTDQKAGLTMTVFVIIYVVIVGLLYFYNRSLILADLIQFSTQYKGIQNTLLKELTVPYAIILEDGHILWKNDRFSEIVDGREKFIQKVIPELNKGIFRKMMRPEASWRSHIRSGIIRWSCAGFPLRASARVSGCCRFRKKKSILSHFI